MGGAGAPHPLPSPTRKHSLSPPTAGAGALLAVSVMQHLQPLLVRGGSSSSSSGADASWCGAPDAEGMAEMAAAAAAAAAAAPTPGELGDAKALSDAADAALRHLLLYVYVDQAYRAALGLYDLPLAFMVVSNAQRDPAEHMAQLAEFGRDQPEPLRRAAVDTMLGRHARALAHLAAAGPANFPAALALARERGLLRRLLAITRAQADAEAAAATAATASRGGEAAVAADAEARLASAYATPAVLSAGQRLLLVLAEHGGALAAARKHEDAALAYMCGGLLDRAMLAYRCVTL